MERRLTRRELLARIKRARAAQPKAREVMDAALRRRNRGARAPERSVEARAERAEPAAPECAAAEPERPQAQVAPPEQAPRRRRRMPRSSPFAHEGPGGSRR